MSCRMDAYDRLTPELMGKRLEKFHSRFERLGPGECWIWTGPVDQGGYGRMYLYTDETGKNVLTGTHRFAWYLENGPITPNTLVCHHCDTPPCVNPSHLFLGTHADNAHDRDNNGRQVAPKGADNGNARLGEPSVMEMRRLRAAGTSYADIGARLGLPCSTVWRACVGNSWAHVTQAKADHEPKAKPAADAAHAVVDWIRLRGAASVQDVHNSLKSQVRFRRAADVAQALADAEKRGLVRRLQAKAGGRGRHGCLSGVRFAVA